jgi:predicted outer membrane repeat protein
LLYCFPFSDFVNNSGGAIYAYRSKVTIRGGHHTFINNTGAIYGGAISLQRWSSIAFLDVRRLLFWLLHKVIWIFVWLWKVESVRFVDNVAKVFGGAIWADQTSSSESYIELLNDISGITTSVGCFIELNSSLQFNYGNSNSSAKVGISHGLSYSLVIFIAYTP